MTTNKRRVLTNMLGGEFQDVMSEQRIHGFSINEGQLDKFFEILGFFSELTNGNDSRMTDIKTSYDSNVQGLLVGFSTDSLDVHDFEMKRFCDYMKEMSVFAITANGEEFDDDRMLVSYGVPNVFIKDN